MFGHPKVFGLSGIGEHDRAPEATSEIDFSGDLLGCGIESARDIEVENPIVGKVGKLSAERPAGAGFGSVAFGNLMEFS